MMDMTEPLKAADLNRTHLGLLVSVRNGETNVTDTLRGISHEADLIDERPITQEEPSYVLGRIATVLTFSNVGAMQVAGNSEVRIGG